jgi:hypothetical protein
MPGRVLLQAGMGTATSTAALIEQHDAVLIRIEEPPGPGIAPRAGATVYEHYWLAVRISAFLEIDLVPRGYLDIPVIERLYLRIEATA